MHLCIQIPCLNEAAMLPATLADLPRALDGIERITVVVVDDGSTDGTGDIARKHGVTEVVRHRGNRGLARAFQSGLDRCIELGADIVVNTDADNQYRGSEIGRLIAPILQGEADIAVGDRRTETVAHFPPLKKLLQRWGSRLVSALAGTPVPDATSGFRALTREAAMRMNVISDFTYTLETLIQGGKKRLRIVSVPIGVNPPTRPSRLFPSQWHYVVRSAPTILRIYARYEPLRTFLVLAVVPMMAAAGFGVRYVYFWRLGQAEAHTQSLLLSVTAIVVALQLAMVAILADLIAANRALQERRMYLERRRGDQRS